MYFTITERIQRSSPTLNALSYSLTCSSVSVTGISGVSLLKIVISPFTLALTGRAGLLGALRKGLLRALTGRAGLLRALKEGQIEIKGVMVTTICQL